MADLVHKSEIADSLQGNLELLNRRQADEFRALLGEPPDPRNVPQAFWDRVRHEQQEEILVALLLIFMTSYNSHRTWGQMEPPDTTDRRDRVAQRWSERRAARTASDFVSHSKGMADTARREWVARTRRGEPIPAGDVDGLVDRIFGKSRAETIAGTEIQVGMVEGGDAGVIHSKAEITRYWGHSGRRDKGHSNAAIKPCPVCSPLEGLPESAWGGLRPGSCHPRCDCFIVYVDSSGFVVGTNTGGMRPGNSPNKVWAYIPP